MEYPVIREQLCVSHATYLLVFHSTNDRYDYTTHTNSGSKESLRMPRDRFAYFAIQRNITYEMEP